MERITQKEQQTIHLLLKNGVLQSSAVHAELMKNGQDVSLVTVKRMLSDLAKTEYLVAQGSGRSTAYTVGPLGRIFADIDARAYCSTEPDKRYGLDRYNFDLLPHFPGDVFSQSDSEALERATAHYEQRTRDLPPAIQKKELERLIIELSWKSSKIEGNTYTLLDTEKLILENKEAPGHDKQEARMILNHKDAFTFVHEHPDAFQNLTLANLEEVHAILIHDMRVGKGLRSKGVGVVGSKYRPLDTSYQIAEAIEALSAAVARMITPYGKALLVLLGISYIQPFEDGNKRTSRLMANALLLASHRAPLSYRSVEENDYREAMLVFYEINSLVPFRRIFVEQYLFAAKTYAVV